MFYSTDSPETAAHAKASFALVDGMDENGRIEAGIAAGADKSLEKKYKLHLPAEAFRETAGDGTYSSYNRETCFVVALAHLPDDLVRDGVWAAIVRHALLLIIKCGWYDLNSDDVIPAEDKKDVDEAHLAVMTEDKIGRAASVIAATKLHYYATNHHVGTGELAGYVKRIADSILPEGSYDIRAAATVMRVIGHWASTAKILGILGVPGLKGWLGKGKSCFSEMTALDDTRLRVSTLPAGCARLAFAVAAIKKCQFCVPFRVLFDAHKVRAIRAMHAEVMRDPMSYHPGARIFAASSARKLDTSGFDDFIDGLVVIVKGMYGSSTLAQSKVVPRVASDVEYYDDRLASLCVDCVRSRASSMESLLSRAKTDTGAGLSLSSESRIAEVLAEPTTPSAPGSEASSDESSDAPEPPPKRSRRSRTKK